MFNPHFVFLTRKSQVDLKPLKNINHLMKEPQKFMIVKCDKD